MHTVEMLEQAVDLTRRLGYQIRQEALGGTGGGFCELKGMKVFFLDLDLSPAEQLDQLLDALAKEPALSATPTEFPMPHDLDVAIDLRRGPWR